MRLFAAPSPLGCLEPMGGSVVAVGLSRALHPVQEGSLSLCLADTLFPRALCCFVAELLLVLNAT